MTSSQNTKSKNTDSQKQFDNFEEDTNMSSQQFTNEELNNAVEDSITNQLQELNEVNNYNTDFTSIEEVYDAWYKANEMIKEQDLHILMIEMKKEEKKEQFTKMEKVELESMFKGWKLAMCENDINYHIDAEIRFLNEQSDNQHLIKKVFDESYEGNTDIRYSIEDQDYYEEINSDEEESDEEEEEEE